MAGRDMTHTLTTSVTTSVVTAFVALWPSEVAGYLVKLVSVLILAMVAEIGRRAIGWLASKRKS